MSGTSATGHRTADIRATRGGNDGRTGKTLTGKQDDALLAVLNRFTEDVTEKPAAANRPGIRARHGNSPDGRYPLTSPQNNPILVGEPGVGKTALVEGLALRIAEGNVPDSLKRCISAHWTSVCYRLARVLKVNLNSG